jgi:hypothetical protein
VPNVAVVDFYFNRTTKFTVKLPADPATLGLENPYVGRPVTWYPAYREWSWFVPSLSDILDPGQALALVLPFHPAGRPMVAPPESHV